MPYTTDQARSRLIFLSDELPHDGIGILIHYEHEPVIVAGWTTIDVREIVSLNEDKWLAEIDFWHRELSERATELTRWWWLLPGSRLTLWAATTPFTLKPILFALAVINLRNRQSMRTIWIVGVPDELAAYLSEWMSNEKLGQIEDKRARAGVKGGDIRFFNTIKFWLKLAKQIASFLRHVAFRRKRSIGSASVIVNSLILNPNLIQSNGDHFFGHMLDNIGGLPNSDIAWLYNDIAVDFRSARSNLAEIGRRAYFISDLFRWSDFWFALSTGFVINLVLRKLLINPLPLLAGGLVASSFTRNFISCSVIQNIPLVELILYRQFSNVLRDSGASFIVYPYEEKPVERALLFAVRDFAPQVKTIGFAHAAYSKGHLYIRRAIRGEPPRPDFIAVTGQIAQHRFEEAGVPREQIVTVGSPRNRNLARDTPDSRSKTRRRILFLNGYGFEMRIFAALMEKKLGLFDKYDLVIRRYPYAWLEEQDAAERRMRAAGIAYKCEGGDLITQIDESDIVLFESTSAGMEATLRGKLVIRLNLSDIISSNHFDGSYGCEEVKCCRNAEELEAQLDSIASLTSDQYAMTIKRQRDLVERLYSPIDQVAIDNLLVKSTLSAPRLQMMSNKWESHR